MWKTKDIRFRVFSYILMLFICMGSILPSYAATTESTEEWEDPERQEEAWMTYLLTDWPLNQLRISVDGVNFMDDTVYAEEFDELYTPLIQELLDDLEGTDFENDCLYGVQSYFEIMKFMCAYMNYICMNAYGDSIYKYYDDASTFQFNEVWKKDPSDSSKCLVGCPAAVEADTTPIHIHDINDIAFNSIFLSQNYAVADTYNDKEAKLHSLKMLLAKFVENELDGEQNVVGDVYSSDMKLVGAMVRMFCPAYPHTDYEPLEFQEHFAKIFKSSTNVTNIKNGSYYPWIKQLGHLGDTDDVIATSPFKWGNNYGDTDLDGEVDYVADTSVDAGGETHYGARDDPTYFADCITHYVGATITYTFDNYSYWGSGTFNGVNGDNVTPASGSTGADLVEYAKQFIGNPYVYGGTSLTEGCDCSGFTLSIYAEYGVTLPHDANAQASYGTQIATYTNNNQIDESILKPGDLLFFKKSNETEYSHVGIYVGGGMMVNAVDSNNGIKETTIYRTSKPLREVRRLL